MEVVEFLNLHKIGRQGPPGALEPVFDKNGTPLFGDYVEIHHQSTLKLPHWRGEANVQVSDKYLPKKGDCRTGNKFGPVSGIYLELGPKFYQDYTGYVYHRAPLEFCSRSQMCEVTRLIGRITGSDGVLYHLFTCVDGCVLLKQATRDNPKVFKWVKNPLRCPLWVTSCSDEGGAKQKKTDNDRMKKGALKYKPQEQEKDVRKKPPDATIVVDGVKYQVTKKGKVRSEKTKDGLYHNKNKPAESRKKLEKALLAWAFLAMLHICTAVNITQWNLADEGTEGVHRVMFERGINRSLHGIWPQQICHGIPSYNPTNRELSMIVGMVDASIRTNYTCCNLQRHEWNKHGWCNWYNIIPWIKVMNYSQRNLTEGTYGKECAVTCRHDSILDINIVTQARNQPTMLTGCKIGKNFSFSGEIREKPCNYDIQPEEILHLPHECGEWYSEISHQAVDMITNGLEASRNSAAKVLSWIGRKLERIGKRAQAKSKTWFGAQASEVYCKVEKRVGSLWYTRNCTPACLPGHTEILGAGVFDTNPQGRSLIPRLPGHITEAVILSLVALSEVMPETSSALYIALHYFLHPMNETIGYCDKNQLNLTITTTVDKVIPNSVYVLGQWVCVKPGWWPYDSEVTLVVNEVINVLDIGGRAARVLLQVWDAATAIAVLIFIMKVARGQLIQGLIWLLLLTGTEALECDTNFQYALAKGTKIGPLGAEELTTTYRRLQPGEQLTDGLVTITCTNHDIIIHDQCSIERRWIAKIHPQALPTSVQFYLAAEPKEAPKIIEMSDEFEFAICPCDALPLVKGNFNCTLTNAQAFQMVCPYGWVGTIECVKYSPTTLSTTVVQVYKRGRPFPRRRHCTTEEVFQGNYYTCEKGGNWTCQPGHISHGHNSDEVEECEWCGFRSLKPSAKLGRCIRRGEKAHRLYDTRPCKEKAFTFSPAGEVECLLGGFKVRVDRSDTTNELLPMPCNPIKVGSQGPVSRAACTYNYSQVLRNSYYEERDKFWQQYMIKDGYQYWFDLEADDHHKNWFNEFLVVVVVALLGGRYILWLIIIYMTLTYYPDDAALVNTGDTVAIGNILFSNNFEVVSYFLLIYVLLKNEPSKRWVILLYHTLVQHPLKTLTALTLTVVDMVKGDTNETSANQYDFMPMAALVVAGLVSLKVRDFSLIPALVLTLATNTLHLCNNMQADVTICILLTLVVLWTYITPCFKYSRVFRLVVSLLYLVFLVRALSHIGSIHTPAIELPRVRPIVIILSYFTMTVLAVNVNIDVASTILSITPTIMTLCTLWADMLTVLVVLPSYEVTKLYYLEKVKENETKPWVRFGLKKVKIKTLGEIERELVDGKEKVFELPSLSTGNSQKSSLVSIVRCCLIACVSSHWRSFYLLYLILELSYWAHSRIIKEVAGSTNWLSRTIATMIEMNWVMDSDDVKGLKKFFILSGRFRDLMLKHKVANDRIRDWYSEGEVFGMPKILYITKIASLSNSNQHMVCTVCETRAWVNRRSTCPKCGGLGPPVKCGMSLADFEEKKYKRIFIREFDEPGTFREEQDGYLAYTAKGSLFLRNLPILATKMKMVMVGNLGSELSDLEHLGWILRGPAVCKKIVCHEKTKPTVMDKLSCFFGLMPRGSTPRAPVRFPTAIIKVRRGLEVGWAYTHQGGISSVEHVTSGKDLFVSDSMGRTRVLCQSSNKNTDETEYGIKTDSSCAEGSRCYVFNPEATNIAGTRGALVHLRKQGCSYTCVTALGTPAFYDLKNLRGWSGLPIFEASTGKVVGRVKVGVNEESKPTAILSGTRAVSSKAADLEVVVKKLENMARGEFKQITLATGAGKTTELPRGLIERIGRHKRVLVLIPLRAAAESVYQYMRQKHPSIAFNLRIGDLKEGDMATGITYASYGYFCQMTQPKLRSALVEYSYIFLDEYHCATPEQLAVMSKMHRFSDQLRVVAMTATPAGTVTYTGQKFPIEEVIIPDTMKGEDLGENFLDIAGLKVPRDEMKNNVLVFVPTRNMALETAKNLKAKGYNSGYYYSGEDPEGLRSITSQSPYIIIATNAIESGVTLPDLDTVIDTGLKCEKRVRIAKKPPYIVTGLKRMAITIGEQAQRRGRVGRVKPGKYYRSQETAAGSKDYHYDLLQAQKYGVEDGINITKSFREMNYDWSLYEEDTMVIAQLEVLNNLLISDELGLATRNIMARTTNPEPIQIAYNSYETQVPVLFPRIVRGEVTNTYEDHNYINCRKLAEDVPCYIYATEDEDLAVDLLGLEWPDASNQTVKGVEQALEQIVGLSTGETALLVALFGYVGYQALSKRHIPVVTDIYTIEDQKIEDTSPLQFAPDSLASPTIEMRELAVGDVERVKEEIMTYAKKGIDFIQMQAEKMTKSTTYNTSKETVLEYMKKFLEAIKENEDQIIRYSLWGCHTALYKSIKERLGHETAFATLVVKWLAFGEPSIDGHIKQAATDLVVYYIINRPKFEGDTQTMDEGRRFVAALLVSTLASYTYKSYNYEHLGKLVEPVLNYLPYSASVLRMFSPGRLESVVILSSTIYKSYLAIKKGRSDGLAGAGISAAMEIMTQNPVTIGIAVLLGVGAIAAHNAIESSEQKRTLLMKVFVKNFLDQAATDELVKESPEKIIMALFEAIQTVGNPLRLIFHLYACYYKKWDAKEIAERTAGRNLFMLIIYEGLELLGVDSEGKMRQLSGNYIMDLIHRVISNVSNSTNRCLKNLLWRIAPAPISCDWSNFDERIGLPTLQYDRTETKCTCGYTKSMMKTSDGRWNVLEEKGPVLCRNRGEVGLLNYKVTSYYNQREKVNPVIKLKGEVELYYSGGTYKLICSHNQRTIVATSKWQVQHSEVSRLLTRFSGFGVGGSSLGDQPDYDALVHRKCATITKTSVVFVKLEKGCAFTTDLTIQNLTKLIELVHKNKLEDQALPEVITGTIWLAFNVVNANIGYIKPTFGEKIIPEPEEATFMEEVIQIKQSKANITCVGEAEVMTTGVTKFTNVQETENQHNQVEIGIEKGQFPGPYRQTSRLEEVIEQKDGRPYLLVIGKRTSMSMRARTAKNIKFFTGRSEILLRDLMEQGKVITVALCELEDDLIPYIDYKGSYLNREALEALARGQPKKKKITKAIARRLLQPEEEDTSLPEWLHVDQPFQLTITRKQESYHIIGDLQSVKEKAKQLGASENTKIVKEKNATIYTMKLSNWLSYESKYRNCDLTALFEELLLRCTPISERKDLHMASPVQMANGNWWPLRAEVHFGRIPCIRRKTHPYEAYVELKELVERKESSKLLGEHSLRQHNHWILKKISEPGTLNTKMMLNPGKIGGGVRKEKRKNNVYNSRIGAIMHSIGIKMEKLPVVRAQTDTRSFHSAIKEKIDKKENEQEPNMHPELYKIFEVFSKGELASTYDEVTWEELENGINRKGAAGVLEDLNIGEILLKDKAGVTKIIRDLRAGKKIKYYETAIPKNEKRDVTDDWVTGDYVEEKKPRVIQYPEAHVRLAITKVMYSWVKQKPVVIPGYEGKTPLFNVFNKVHKEWKGFQDPVAVSFDTKAWDTQVTTKDLLLIARIQKFYFKQKWHKFIDTITEHMCEVPVVTEDGEVYIRQGQRGSGQPDTSAGNSMLNVLTMVLAFCRATGIPYKSFPRVAKIHVCGDDGFLITERPLAERFSRHGVQLLHELGKPQKITTENNTMKLAYNFEDIEFCSHTPIQVRWSDNSSSYMAGRETATILAKMATRLDSSGERGSEAYERAVAFSFLLMYSWNPLVRRICLLVLSICDQPKMAQTTMFYSEGDPVAAYEEVVGHKITQLNRTEFRKLAKLNLSMSILGIWTKHTSKRLLEDCIKRGMAEGNHLVNADRLVSQKTGNSYTQGTGHVKQGKHYEELIIPSGRRITTTIVERYSLGPIKTFILKRLRLLTIFLSNN
ncbi:polyprotein [Pronghorn antelope pestivirus]|uniref:Genome polyprotein n=1 Tax=Pronghorn antelope pestivirus TaxID=188938 RepID=Q533M7_9FLAV|nr:polyprotein [Pronghorn antelope pestivirus]AAX12371.2 polyprotein [Pronghorn antelope pestivirus]